NGQKTIRGAGAKGCGADFVAPDGIARAREIHHEIRAARRPRGEEGFPRGASGRGEPERRGKTSTSRARLRVYQRRAVLRRGAAERVGVSYWRVSGVRKVAEGPQRAQ